MSAVTIPTREFPIDEVLSVYTGRLVARRGIEAMYDLLNWMTGDNLYTHQLGRACAPCKASLLEQFPELGNFGEEEALAALDKALSEDANAEVVCKQWVLHIATGTYGGTLRSSFPVAPDAEWEHRDPVEELVAMVGPDKVCVMEASDVVDA
jgi:hypothetical protein